MADARSFQSGHADDGEPSQALGLDRLCRGCPLTGRLAATYRSRQDAPRLAGSMPVSPAIGRPRKGLDASSNLNAASRWRVECERSLNPGDRSPHPTRHPMIPAYRAACPLPALCFAVPTPLAAMVATRPSPGSLFSRHPSPLRTAASTGCSLGISRRLTLSINNSLIASAVHALADNPL